MFISYYTSGNELSTFFWCSLMLFVGPFGIAQEDFSDTTEVNSKSYINIDFDALLDSITVLELETGEEVERFLMESVSNKLYMRHDYAALMDSLAWLVGELFDCGTDVVSFDGHDYTTVEIGGQCWFAENLRTTVYRDGTAIPSELDDSEWTTTTSGSVTVYDEGGANEATNVATYGRLYNWYAVDHSISNPGQELCPEGWHVPTDSEWMVLESALGMLDSDTASTAERGATEALAGKLKTTGTEHWSGTNSDATNESGFSALPGGYRNSGGPFYELGNIAYFWSSSAGDDGAWYRALVADFAGIWRYETSAYNLRYGYSVRCLQGELIAGCMDSGACNYDATAMIDDGGCTYTTTWYADADGDGLGDASTTQDACDQPTGYVSDSSDNCDDTTANNYSDGGNPACEYDCGTVTFDGYDYNTVVIGGQCWFAENLRTTIYEDGSAAPYSEYNDDPANVDTYGRLYNWIHRSSPLNLCPTGWHVSKYDDWVDMISELGGESEAGGKLKESGTTHWTAPNTSASNESGFTALPGGSMDTNGDFSGLGTVGHFWTSISASPGSAVSYKLNYDSGAISVAVVSQTLNRCSVRCVED